MKFIKAIKQLEQISKNSIDFQDSMEVVPLDKTIEIVNKIYSDFKKKNTFDVNIKLTDLEPFITLINLLKENIDSLPTELKDKLSEILEK